MNKSKKGKFPELNEYGEISISTSKPEKDPSTPWDARFFKQMVVLLLIVVFLVFAMNGS